MHGGREGGCSFLLPGERGPGPNWVAKPRRKEFTPRQASRSPKNRRKLPPRLPSPARAAGHARPEPQPRPRCGAPARPDGARPGRGQPPPRSPQPPLCLRRLRGSPASRRGCSKFAPGRVPPRPRGRPGKGIARGEPLPCRRARLRGRSLALAPRPRRGQGKPPWTQHTLKHEVSPSLSSSRENFYGHGRNYRAGRRITRERRDILLLRYCTLAPTPLHLLPPPPPSGPLLFSEPGAPATQEIQPDFQGENKKKPSFCVQGERSATAAIRAAPPAGLPPSAPLDAQTCARLRSPPAPEDSAPGTAPAPLIYAFVASPEKRPLLLPLSLCLRPPPRAPRGAGGVPADAAPAAAPSAQTERRPPGRQSRGGSPRRAVPRRGRPAGGGRRVPPLRRAPAPHFASGRGVSRGAPNNKGKFESSRRRRRRTGCGDVREQCRCQPARPPPLKGVRGAAGGPRRRPRGWKGRGSCTGPPALQPSAAAGSLRHCPPERGAEQILCLTAASFPPFRAVPRAVSAALIAAWETRRPPGRERSGPSGPGRAPRGPAGLGGPRSGQRGLRAHCPGRLYEPCDPPGECFRQEPAPRGSGLERFQPLLLLHSPSLVPVTARCPPRATPAP
ncbi:basic proline-rich protein-like [Serinus canaria]|uniref:basic proline-rich protein-like n=1 Tax=Serinus canaria TaxID=9135 RepID=UPI0021CCD8D8|nr:basic proline-rich protein-like [Serinus canaria]